MKSICFFITAIMLGTSQLPAQTFNKIQAQIPSYLPGDSLIAWYPFNGNADDLSGNGNNGFAVSATLNSDRFNNANTAYELSIIGSGITLLNGGA